ncbi:hypothetical protein SKAU_G00130970 [Synaphobranchus kaupii]|uniref:Uncharacterized protein n=1 Tax=Synaphobranchus kaupii TaxID=118154 RepID=A0A9Q1J305_SYNKA|nr:hypothetical protein SKAU_G00130970 [Synaphobranchus kaupii]
MTPLRPAGPSPAPAGKGQPPAVTEGQDVLVQTQLETVQRQNTLLERMLKGSPAPTPSSSRSSCYASSRSTPQESRVLPAQPTSNPADMQELTTHLQLLQLPHTEVDRYATPLIRVENPPPLKAPKEAVMARLWSTENRLAKDPATAAAYCAEVEGLKQAGTLPPVCINGKSSHSAQPAAHAEPLSPYRSRFWITVNQMKMYTTRMNVASTSTSAEEAKQLVEKLRALLASGGFELRQWASNLAAVISHLPKEARSESSKVWLSENKEDPQELALGLRWSCQSDIIGYRHRPVEPTVPTMRPMHKFSLASTIHWATSFPSALELKFMSNAYGIGTQMG